MYLFHQILVGSPPEAFATAKEFVVPVKGPRIASIKPLNV